MKLPAALQRQVDAAEQLESSMRGENQVAPPQDPAPVPDQPNESPAPVQAELFTPAEAPAPKQEDNRYEVLKGKYDAEVPRLAREARELRERLEAQARELEDVKRRSEKPEEKPVPTVTEKDVSDFGADIIDLIRRVATEVVNQSVVPYVNSSIAALDSRIKASETAVGSVAQAQHMTAEEKFYSNVADEVADWETINVDPKWLTWLTGEDGMSGLTRQALLDQAVAVLDAKRVVKIFNSYKQEHNISTQGTKPPVQKTDDLSKQVSPSRSAAVAAPAADQGNVWTDAAIRAFTKDISTGKFKGREELQAQIQADLDAAYHDGRYRSR